MVGRAASDVPRLVVVPLAEFVQTIPLEVLRGAGGRVVQVPKGRSVVPNTQSSDRGGGATQRNKKYRGEPKQTSGGLWIDRNGTDKRLRGTVACGRGHGNKTESPHALK